MNKIFLSVLVLMLIAGNSFAADEATTVRKSDSVSKTDGTESATSERDSDNITHDEGERSSWDWSSGNRESVRKDLSKALAKINNRSLSKSINLVPLFVTAYTQKYKWLNNVSVDDVLLVSTDGGREYQYMSNLDAIGRVNGRADDHIDRAKVRSYMSTLQSLGFTISKNVKILPKQIWGLADWQEAANAAAMYSPMYSGTYKIDGACYFNGSFNRIRCGQCTLDMTMSSGIPTLECNGTPILTPGAAGGITMVAAVNESESLSETLTHSQSSEFFKQFSKAFQKHIADSASKGNAVEAVRTQRSAIQKIVAQDKSYAVTIAKAQKSNDASLLTKFKGL